MRGNFFRLKGVIEKSVSFMCPAKMANDQDKIMIHSLLGKIWIKSFIKLKCTQVVSNNPGFEPNIKKRSSVACGGNSVLLSCNALFMTVYISKLMETVYSDTIEYSDKLLCMKKMIVFKWVFSYIKVLPYSCWPDMF